MESKIVSFFSIASIVNLFPIELSHKAVINSPDPHEGSRTCMVSLSRNFEITFCNKIRIVEGGVK